MFTQFLKNKDWTKLVYKFRVRLPVRMAISNAEKMWFGFSPYCSISDVLHLLLFCITFRLFCSAELKSGLFYRRASRAGVNRMQMIRCRSSLWETSGTHSGSAAHTAPLYLLFWMVAAMTLFRTTSLTYLQSSFTVDSGGTWVLPGNTQLSLWSHHVSSWWTSHYAITCCILQVFWRNNTTNCFFRTLVSFKLKQLVALFLHSVQRM